MVIVVVVSVNTTRMVMMVITATVMTTVMFVGLKTAVVVVIVVVIGTVACAANTNQTAIVATISSCLRFEGWRLANRFESSQTLGQRCQPSNIVVDVIDLVVFFGDLIGRLELLFAV